MDRLPAKYNLDQITLAAVSPATLVRIAADVGYDGVSVWVNRPTDTVSIPALRQGTAALRDLKRALAETGLKVNGVECFDVTAPRADDATRRALEVAAGLGAPMATALFFASVSESQASEDLAHFARLAAEFNMSAAVEFMAKTLVGSVNSCGEALRVVEGTGLSNVGITVDMLHLGRTHAVPSDLKILARNRIAYIQLCDARLTLPDADHIYESGTHRLYPGEGELPIAEYLSVLPDGIPFGVEIPRTGEEPNHIARFGLESAKRFVERPSGAR